MKNKEIQQENEIIFDGERCFLQKLKVCRVDNICIARSVFSVTKICYAQ